MDDGALYRRVCELLLARIGCEVVCAADAGSAIEKTRAHEFDLILTDVEMPGMDGFEALPLLREADATAHPNRKHPLWIVALSAGQPGMSAQDFIEIGFDQLLTKPLEVDRISAIFRAMEGARPRAKELPAAHTSVDGSVRIHQDLTLTPEQVSQLDLHSFLNVLNILMGELQLIRFELGDPSALPETARLGAEVLERVRAGQLDEEASRKAAALRQSFEQEWSKLRAQHPVDSKESHLTECADNLQSILEVLVARLHDYQERLSAGSQWRPHNIRELTHGFANVFAAIEKNSKGRYRIIHNIAAQDAADYLVNFQIESVDGDFITLPPILVDVFRDLVANARKYTAPGGEITAGLVDTGTELRLVVEDTGCGIPPEELSQVVQFGYRASNVRGKATRGGGFGLTKAYYHTTRLGGTMWIRSTVGRGTRVTIRIPRPKTSAPLNGTATR